MKLYVFDLGGVCIFNFQTVGKIAKHYSVDEAALTADYHDYDIPLMDGSVMAKEWWQHAREKFGIAKGADANPVDDFFTPYTNAPVLEIIKELKARGGRVVCGSNTCEEHWIKMNACGGFEELFDECYLSQRMRLAKPDVQFFEYILQHEGVSANDAFFVDDNTENVKAAESIGMNVLQFRDTYEWSALDKLKSIVLA